MPPLISTARMAPIISGVLIRPAIIVEASATLSEAAESAAHVGQNERRKNETILLSHLDVIGQAARVVGPHNCIDTRNIGSMKDVRYRVASTHSRAATALPADRVVKLKRRRRRSESDGKFCQKGENRDAVPSLFLALMDIRYVDVVRR